MSSHTNNPLASPVTPSHTHPTSCHHFLPPIKIGPTSHLSFEIYLLQSGSPVASLIHNVFQLLYSLESPQTSFSPKLPYHHVTRRPSTHKFLSSSLRWKNLRTKPPNHERSNPLRTLNPLWTRKLKLMNRHDPTTYLTSISTCMTIISRENTPLG